MPLVTSQKHSNNSSQVRRSPPQPLSLSRQARVNFRPEKQDPRLALGKDLYRLLRFDSTALALPVPNGPPELLLGGPARGIGMYAGDSCRFSSPVINSERYLHPEYTTPAESLLQVDWHADHAESMCKCRVLRKDVPHQPLPKSLATNPGKTSSNRLK